MLLTVIPYFREVIVVSFHCDHCGYKNNDIQAAGEIQSLGSIYTVKCNSYDDLDRQLVKSEHCLISIPEYQLQIPAGRGQFTTIEGVLSDTIRDLEHDQPLRKIQHPELFEKIGELVDKLRLIVPDLDKDDTLDVKPVREAQGPMPHFTLKLDDPSGNSFVETRGGLNDPKWRKQEYGRSREQDNALGLAHDESQSKETSHYPEEVLSFPGVCSLCGSELETLMKTVNIPHFKVSLPNPRSHACDINFFKSSRCSLLVSIERLNRISFSCLQTATTAVTEIPKSSLGELSPRKDEGSPSR
jgi:zinc finger protein